MAEKAPQDFNQQSTSSAQSDDGITMQAADHIGSYGCLDLRPLQGCGGGRDVGDQIMADSMAQEILSAHNKYRAEVGVPPLEWSGDLANHAQE